MNPSDAAKPLMAAGKYSPTLGSPPRGSLAYQSPTPLHCTVQSVRQPPLHRSHADPPLFYFASFQAKLIPPSANARRWLHGSWTALTLCLISVMFSKVRSGYMELIRSSAFNIFKFEATPKTTMLR